MSALYYCVLQASVANIGKNISFLSASASRAAIHHSFALKENLADITAKSGSQTILSSLVGTSVGVLVASQIGDDYNAQGGQHPCHVWKPLRLLAAQV
jgi:hypothetical protein